MADERESSETLDPDVRLVVDELCRAINKSLNESTALGGCVDALKEKGYELSLVLDARLHMARATGQGSSQKTVRLSLSDKDQQFLRGMRIALDSRPGT